MRALVSYDPDDPDATLPESMWEQGGRALLEEPSTLDVALRPGETRELVEELPMVEDGGDDNARTFVNAPTAEQLERLIELTIAQRDESARGYAALLAELQAIGGQAGKGVHELRSMRQERLQDTITPRDGRLEPAGAFNLRDPRTWSWWKRGEESCRGALTRIFGIDVIGSSVVGIISGTLVGAWMGFAGALYLFGPQLVWGLLAWLLQ